MNLVHNGLFQNLVEQSSFSWRSALYHPMTSVCEGIALKLCTIIFLFSIDLFKYLHICKWTVSEMSLLMNTKNVLYYKYY